MENEENNSEEIGEQNLFCDKLKIKIIKNKHDLKNNEIIFNPIFMHQIIDYAINERKNFAAVSLNFNRDFSACFVDEDYNLNNRINENNKGISELNRIINLNDRINDNCNRISENNRQINDKCDRIILTNGSENSREHLLTKRISDTNSYDCSRQELSSNTVNEPKTSENFREHISFNRIDTTKSSDNFRQESLSDRIIVPKDTDRVRENLSSNLNTVTKISENFRAHLDNPSIETKITEDTREFSSCKLIKSSEIPDNHRDEIFSIPNEKPKISDNCREEVSLNPIENTKTVENFSEQGLKLGNKDESENIREHFLLNRISKTKSSEDNSEDFMNNPIKKTKITDGVPKDFPDKFLVNPIKETKISENCLDNAGGNTAQENPATESFIDLLTPFLPNLKSRDIFLSHLDNFINLNSIGEVINSYTIDGITYEIRQNDFSHKEMVEFYKNIQILCLLFIDASSVLDFEDPAWRVFLLFQKSEGGDIFVGYSAAYNFYSFPDKIRARIGHFLILPPFQGCGHGKKFLKSILEFHKSDEYSDICVEDGNDDFLYIWDLLNCQRALEMDEFQNINTNSILTDDLVEKCQKKLKIRRFYSKRVFEILKLKYYLDHYLDLKKYQEELLANLNTMIDRESKRMQKISRVLSAEVLQSVFMGLEARRNQNKESIPLILDSYERVVEKL